MAFPLDTVASGKKILYDDHFKEGYDVVLAWNDVLRARESEARQIDYQ